MTCGPAWADAWFEAKGGKLTKEEVQEEKLRGVVNQASGGDGGEWKLMNMRRRDDDGLVIPSLNLNHNRLNRYCHQKRSVSVIERPGLYL